MADTTLATASQVAKWDANFFAEYVRNSGFKPYMSKGANSVIVAKYQLTDVGKSINIPLVTRLTGAGVSGSTALEGAEEALNNYNQNISIDWSRNGVLITKDQQHYTEMDLRKAAKEMLTLWAMEDLRTKIITALGSINGVAYGTATEGQKDTWVAANSDRIQFGDGSVGGYTDHSADLTAVTAGMTLDAAAVSRMKAIAKTADPHIRPMKTMDGSGREYFVMFTDSRCFRDLKTDTTIAQANREARPRDIEKNPIFQDGDLIYDGVIVREIPEIASVGTVGASSAPVSPAYLCGAQSVGVAWGQEPKSTTDVRDYGFRRGCGVEFADGVEKLVFNGVQHGVVTGYFGATAI